MNRDEWGTLVEELPKMTLEEAEGRLAVLVGLRIRLGSPLLFVHENGRPLAALVPVGDMAAIEALRKHPEILTLLQEASGTTFRYPVCSGGK